MRSKGSSDQSWCPSEGLSFTLWKYSLLASMLVELRLMYVVELSGAVIMSGTQNVSLISNLNMVFAAM